METTLILAALAALVISVILVAGMSARSRRPELRLPREDDFEADGEETLMRSLTPPPPSPIDRAADILDLEPVREPARLPPGGQARLPSDADKRLPPGGKA